MNYRGPDFQVAFRRGATGYGGGDFLLLSICFLAGAVLGMYVGAYASDISDAGGLFSGELSASDGFLGALWECSKYHFLVLLFSTSFLGIFLIPATLAFRGYLLGCASAVIAASAGKGAFWLIMAKFGAVSLITVPCLFVIGCDAMYLARSVSLRGAVGERRKAGSGIIRRLVICFSLLAVTAALKVFLLPAVMGGST